MTCGLGQQSIDELNSYGQLLLDKDIAIGIVFIYYHSTKQTKGTMFVTID